MVMCRFLCVTAFSLLYLHTASKASKHISISIILFFFRHSFRIFIYEWMVMCTQFWLVIDLSHYDKARQNKSFLDVWSLGCPQKKFLDQSCQMLYRYTTKVSNLWTNKQKTAAPFSFTLLLQWGNQPKMRFGHNFWLGGPNDKRSMRLNCILQDLFRDTPLDHIWRAQIRAPNTVFGVFDRNWAHTSAR